MSTSIDQQFVEYVVKSLVGNPDAVKIERRIDEKGVLLELSVDPEDLGRVIGKRGATAQSLRTLLRALGTKNEARYNLKIVDVDRLDADGNPLPRPERQSDTRRRDDDTDAASVADDSDDSADSSAATNDGTDAPADASDQKSSASTKSTADGPSDAVARTRAELADLDDLDI